jgi:hypothetical protein
MLALALTLALTGAIPASARAQSSGSAELEAVVPGPEQRVILAALPFGTTIPEISRIESLSPGLVSASIGNVPVAQTYLDISQGNRINKNLYDSDLPRLYVREGRVPAAAWSDVIERAEDAPADVLPGLLGSTLADAGISVAAEGDSGLPTLSAVDREGAVPIQAPQRCRLGCCAGFSLVKSTVSELAELAETVGPDDLLIALTAGVRSDQQLLPAGVVGEGFDGNLTSDSTRTDGVVLTTDIGPTVLEHLGVDVPDEMNGSEIESTDDRDPAGVADLQSKLSDRPDREQVVFLPLVGWVALAALAAVAFRRRGAAVALSLLALACIWAPLILLVAAGLDASELASALMIALGAPALAAITRTAFPAYRGLAVACAVTVGAYAIDVIAGSPYTALSVLGPNPGGGVRFFGIGNELEATLTPLTLIGCGAWQASRGSPSRESAAAWFVGTALVATIAFAPGRFGADVGAAIVLAIGGATAAALALGFGWRRTAVAVAAAGVIGVAALIVADLLLGGAHLSRSVLGAGEASDVLDVLERRATLMWNSFIHPVYPALLVVCGVLLVLGLWYWRQVLAWFGSRWPARCGYVGAVVGVLVGTVANDSGAVLLVIGTIYLAVCAGFVWAQRPHVA